MTLTTIKKLPRPTKPQINPFLATVVGSIVVSSLVFLALGEDVWTHEGFAWDGPVTRQLHTLASPALSSFLEFMTNLGGAPIMAAITALLIGVLALRRQPWQAWFVTLAIGGASALNVLLKLEFHRSRPQIVPHLVPESDFSFPSGHASVSTAVVLTLIALLWPTRWRWIAVTLGLGFVALVGVSRVYLGVHYPSDVLAGWAVTSAWVGATTLLYVLKRPRA